MYTDEDIQSAIDAGILSKTNAAAFRAHVAEGRGTPLVDDEQFRLVTGFTDIFVTVACLLFLGSISWLATKVIDAWVGAVLFAIGAWCLAEYFTLKRLMALPSIALVLSFVGGVFFTGAIVGDEGWETFNEDNKGLILIAVITGIAALFHWLRFKVPITVAVGVGILVAFGYLLMTSLNPELRNWSRTFIFASGILVFFIGMRWDISDPSRRTRRSDIAFWLHLLAAPLLTHPVFSSLGIYESGSTVGAAIGVILLYGLFAVVSIAIDRRALMVSALIYVIYAGNLLLEASGIGLGFALAIFVISTGLLVITIFWNSCRKSLFGLVPESVQRLLPPVSVV